MKVTCKREPLLAAFHAAAAVVPHRSSKPVLLSVKLEVSDDKAVMMATDMELSIRIEVDGVDCHGHGAALLSSARFGAILRESSDEMLTIETGKKGGIVICGERSEFKLPSEDPQDYPTVPEFPEKKALTVPARRLREVIRRTLFATDTESSRYALGGILLECDKGALIGVGTDGRRLAKMTVPATGEVTEEPILGIVPAKAMQLIGRALADDDADVQLTATLNSVLLHSPKVTISSRLVEGRFPKWRDVFPKRQAITIDLAIGPFHAAIRQAAIVTSEESRGIDFKFGGGVLLLAGQAPELGQARVELPIVYDGPPLSISLDPRYLADFLKVLDPQKMVALELKDSDSAAVLTTDDGYGYVVMPLARDK